ncbi:MAG: hypothetical protein AMJ62_12235 [Myxococcales bacterium SG8_38]|nr:MAG: hypothetical protein AMJ62_12235 [Myxococcales bacterium SG8_38]
MRSGDARDAFLNATPTVLLCSVPLLLAAVVGATVLDGGFVYDDPSALAHNPIVNGQVPAWEAFTRDFWGRPWSHRFTTWRPLTPILWAGLWQWFGGDPLPYRALSLLLHVATVAMSMLFVYRLKPSVGRTAAVGTLFALHPLNTEAVSAIVAQADMLSFSLVLGASTIALGSQTVRTGVLCALVLLLGTLFKESAVIFTPLAALLLLLRPGRPRARWAATLPVVVVGVVVVSFQLALPRAPGISMITSNLAYHAEGGMRLLLGLHNIGRALVMTVWPRPIVPNHGYAALELQPDVLIPCATMGGVLLVVGLVTGAWAIKRHRLDWIAALSFLYAPALLQSHLLIRLITDLAERLLYPSTLGISMLASAAIFHFLRRPAMRVGIVGACALVFFAASYSARRAWTQEDALWTYAVRTEPRAAIHHHNVSNTYFRSGELALGAYHRLLHLYLLRRFPDPVPWELVDATESLPVTERFTEMPAVLSPDDPCGLIRAFVAEARQYEPLYEHILRHWPQRYPSCGPWPDR